MGSGWPGHQGVCWGVSYSARGFLFPLMNSLGKAECKKSELLGEIFKGINSCQPGCGICLSACMPAAAEVDFSRESICLAAA